MVVQRASVVILDLTNDILKLLEGVGDETGCIESTSGGFGAGEMTVACSSSLC